MFSRRSMILAGAAGLTTALTPLRPIRAAEAPVIGEDGLYHQSWFLDSFLELEADLEEATDAGRPLAIFWELKGCPYCMETHLVNLARPDINAFIRENFVVLQLNFIGSRIVTDFDGEELSEKQLARKYGVRFTPTVQYFAGPSGDLGQKAPRDREVQRMAGYMKPDHFLGMFKFVRSGAYQTMTFRKYLKSGS